MKKLIALIIFILFISCMPDTYFIGTKSEFLRMGYTEKHIVKIVKMEDGVTKIYFRQN